MGVDSCRSPSKAALIARITVVNDSEEFLGLMREVLDALGHTPTVLDGSKVTVEEIAGTHPHILVIDLHLGSPEVLDDGWALVVGSRAHPELADVPIVVCSGNVIYLRERAAEIAALADVHPLEKPFGLVDVEDLLRRLLERYEVPN
jgi:CheY-like chemotaxis protein